MDDILIFHKDKNFLHNLLCAIKIYLKEELDLGVKSNYQIRRTDEGVDMVGYKHFRDYTLLRKTTKKRLVILYKRITRSLNYSKLFERMTFR
jgi:hypothetical protein